jgi:Flp pilus assembly protein TadB
MAKERALRRAEREREAAARATERAAQEARDARRRSLHGRVRRLVPAARSRPTGVLAARRRARNRLLLAVAVLVQVVAWVLGRSFAVSAGVLVFTVLTTPALARLLLDR